MSNESGTHQRYEDLPVAYSRLWEFENIGATMKEGRRVFGDAAQLSGEYCRIVIGDIDPEVAARYQRERSVKIKLKIKRTYFENKNNTILKIRDLAAKIK